MKVLTVPLVVLMALALSACTDTTGGGITQPVTTMSAGSIEGEFSLDPSVPGVNLANIQVAVYASEADFHAGLPTKVLQTGANGRYVIEGICCGKYYLDAWKDNDANGIKSTGDYYLLLKCSCGCGHEASCTVEADRAAFFGGQMEIVK